MGVLLVSGNVSEGGLTKIYKMPRLTDTETSLTPLKQFIAATANLNDINDNGIIANGNSYANAYDVLTDPFKPSNYMFNQYSMPYGFSLYHDSPIWRLNPNMNAWVDHQHFSLKRFFLDFSNKVFNNITNISSYSNINTKFQFTNNNTTDFFYRYSLTTYSRTGTSIDINCNWTFNVIINNICSTTPYDHVAIFPYNYATITPTNVTKVYNFNSYPSFPGYNPHDIMMINLVHVELSPIAGSNDNVVYYFGVIRQRNTSTNMYLEVPAIFKFTYGETNLVFTEGTNMWIYPEYAAENLSFGPYSTPNYDASNAHYYKKYDGNIYMIINKYVNGSQEAYVGIFNPITYQFKMFRLENMLAVHNMSIYPNIDESIYTYLPSRASII